MVEKWECGAFKQSFCAIINKSTVTCGGDRKKCACPLKREIEFGLMAMAQFEKKGGKHENLARC